MTIGNARTGLLVAAAFALLAGGCRSEGGSAGPRGGSGSRARAARGRTEPVCATQDCATGKIVDDGCSDDGRCTSCVNACMPPVAPSR